MKFKENRSEKRSASLTYVEAVRLLRNNEFKKDEGGKHELWAHILGPQVGLSRGQKKLNNRATKGVYSAIDEVLKYKKIK